MPDYFFKIRIEMELKVQAFPPLSTLFNETRMFKKIDFIFIFSSLRNAAFFFNVSH